MSILSAGPRRAWEEDGWCVLERAVPADRLEAAQRAAAKLFPPAEVMAGPLESRDARWSTWDATWPEFPFRSRSLNALVVSDLLIDLAADLLGTDDVRMYLAIASAKYAGQPSDFNQLLHTDFPNHTLTVAPPRTRVPADGDVHLPQRCRAGERRHPLRLASAHPIHPGGGAHA